MSVNIDGFAVPAAYAFFSKTLVGSTKIILTNWRSKISKGSFLNESNIFLRPCANFCVVALPMLVRTSRSEERWWRYSPAKIEGQLCFRPHRLSRQGGLVPGLGKSRSQMSSRPRPLAYAQTRFFTFKKRGT